jgi:hypothetical protein
VLELGIVIVLVVLALSLDDEVIVAIVAKPPLLQAGDPNRCSRCRSRSCSLRKEHRHTVPRSRASGPSTLTGIARQALCA